MPGNKAKQPAKYEAIKKSAVKSGKPLGEAKSIAAATYNKQRKPGQKPVTGKAKKK